MTAIHGCSSGWNRKFQVNVMLHVDQNHMDILTAIIPYMDG